MWYIYVLCAVVLISLLTAFCYYENNGLSVTRLKVSSNKLTSAFSAVIISDLHGKIFKNDALYKRIRWLKPDVIFFLGDSADRSQNTVQMKKAAEFLSRLTNIAPVYAVSGNHEYGRLNREELFGLIKSGGVNLLRGEERTLNLNGQEIHVFGLDEVGYHIKTPGLLRRFSEREGFKILLSHFPERFKKDYINYDIDLTLSGHAHGGQFILPFVGGIYSPGQGLFPKYYRGMYEENGKKLIVSRGLGNSRFPLRLFNRPEIIVADFIPKN